MGGLWEVEEDARTNEQRIGLSQERGWLVGCSLGGVVARWSAWMSLLLQTVRANKCIYSYGRLTEGW